MRTAGHRRWPAVLVVVLVVALGGAVVWLQNRPEEARLPGAAAPSAAVADRDRAAASTELLRRLEEGLAAGDAGALAALGDPDLDAAGAELRTLAGTARAVRLTDLELRYVDDAELVLDLDQRAEYGEEAWVAEAQLSWRFAGVDPGTSSVDVPVVLDWEGDEAVFVTARLTDGYRVPLWFSADVEVRRSPRTLVLAPDPGAADRLHRQAGAAVRTVNATLPAWRGSLVVESPADLDHFESSSGLSADASRAIAAVTTTTDGGTEETIPRHVYLNPDVFGPLGPQGRQIVLSHEATHVATDAVTTRLPPWLSEGFADYVALVGTDVPERTLAAQIRQLVREEGAPARLPGRAEFAGSNQDIGAWYEAAWLAVRLIADTWGEDAVLRFYRAAERDGDVENAFSAVLGTTQREFVGAWQAELTRLARR